MMKKIASILVFLLLASCISNVVKNQAIPLKAVYFVRGQGGLPSEDLQAHPAVAVVQTFDELKQYAKQKIALWIDKSATPFNSEEEQWINQAPQAYYPIVLIGTSDTLYAFRDLLRLDGFIGPAGDYPGYDAPGFSIIQWEARNNLGFHALILNGYNQKPTVQVILEITNALLEGKLQPTPPVTHFPAATPTRISTSAMGASPVLLYDDWPGAGFPLDATRNISSSYMRRLLVYSQSHRKPYYILSHDAPGDNCTETTEKRLSFDLTPLDESRTDRQANPLLLRIYEPAGGSFAKEPYMPLIEWP